MHTQNFTPQGDPKIHCSCCGNGRLAVGVFILLEELKRYYDGAAVTVTSGPRCTAYNKSVGSNNRSSHHIDDIDMIAEAVDVRVAGVTPRQLYAHMKALPYANLLGLGLYVSDGFVHMDIRGYGARWTG